MQTRSVRSWLFVVTLLGSTGLACGEEEGKPTGATCPTTQTLTYENFGQNFFTTFCSDCHAAASTESARRPWRTCSTTSPASGRQPTR